MRDVDACLHILKEDKTRQHVVQQLGRIWYVEQVVEAFEHEK